MNPTPSRDSFEQLVAAHYGIVRKIAATYRYTAEDRADLSQDILAGLWQAWPRYDGQRTFSTWMYRVALNVAISSHRREQHRRHEPLSEEHDAIEGATDVAFEARQQLDLIAHAMQALSDTDRALMLLHLDGHSHRDIADVLGTTEGNVAVRFTRIKNHLRRQAGTK